MSTVLKVALGVILAFTVLIIGCVALLGVGVNEAQKDSDKAAITQAEYESVKAGADGNSRKRIESRFGKPAGEDEFETDVGDEPVGTECIYYNRKGELASLYQFCFDMGSSRVASKSSF